MKKLVLALSALTLLSGTALAADMPVKAVIAPPPIPSWAGFYIGAHGGYGWKDDPFSFTLSIDPPVLLNGFKSRGWVGGGQAGYNWQYGAVVGGLELDVSATGIKGTSATAVAVQTFGGTIQESEGNNVKLLGSARGRLGWAPNSGWLLYGTGGLAWERADQTFFFGQISTGGSFAQTGITPIDLFGWVLGGGVEARLMGSNWIARLEYLHYDFGHSRPVLNSASASTGFPTTFSINTAGNQTIDVVRAGLSYKFGR
jgi:outer membrane immunogenic protein